MKNKFEHLMTEKHKEELEKEGVVRITELSMTPPQREIHVATISHYVQIRVPYFVYKKITQNLGYQDRLKIYPVVNTYDLNDKTVEITALKPVLNNELIVKYGYKLIDEYFTYGV
jgi:hypothetical protein